MLQIWKQQGCWSASRITPRHWQMRPLQDDREPRLSTQWFMQDSAAGRPRHCGRGQGRHPFTPGQLQQDILRVDAATYTTGASRASSGGDIASRPGIARSAAKSPSRARHHEVCAKCGSSSEQETDVLDTWFSSGLLPFSAGLAGATRADLEAFYPTAAGDGLRHPVLLGGAHDHAGLPLHARGPMPKAATHARTRRCHSARSTYTVWCAMPIGRRCRRPRASDRPDRVIEQYGTDAVRFTLAHGSPGTDIAFNEARTEGYRAFANKIWNAARFIFMQMEESRGCRHRGRSK